MISFLSIKEWACVDDCKEYIKNHNITCDLTYSNKKSPLQRFYDPTTAVSPIIHMLSKE